MPISWAYMIPKVCFNHLSFHPNIPLFLIFCTYIYTLSRFHCNFYSINIYFNVLLFAQSKITYISYCIILFYALLFKRNCTMILDTTNCAKAAITSLVAIDMTPLRCSKSTSMKPNRIRVGCILTLTLFTQYYTNLQPNSDVFGE